MKWIRFSALIIWVLPLIACTDQHGSRTGKLAETFFDHYETRSDWQGFLELYADDMVFEDVIFRYTYDKERFINFYNWPDPSLKKHPDYPEVLVLKDLAITDSSAVGRGYFNPFYYDNVFYADTAHMRFTMWLYFNKEGKIKRHIDYIEYPPVFLKSAAERLMTNDTSGN